MLYSTPTLKTEVFALTCVLCVCYPVPVSGSVNNVQQMFIDMIILHSILVLLLGILLRTVGHTGFNKCLLRNHEPTGDSVVVVLIKMLHEQQW